MFRDEIDQIHISHLIKFHLISVLSCYQSLEKRIWLTICFRVSISIKFTVFAVSSSRAIWFDDLFFWISVDQTRVVPQSGQIHFDLASRYSCKIVSQSEQIHLAYDICKSSNSCKTASQSEHFRSRKSLLLQNRFVVRASILDLRKSLLLQNRFVVRASILDSRKPLFLQSRFAVRVEWRNEENSELRKVNWDENQEMRTRKSHR